LAGLDSRSRLPRALVASGVRRPGVVLAFWLLLGGLAGVGVMRLQVETSTDSILDRSGAQWSAYQESQRNFGGDEFLTILIEGDSPFARAALEEVTRFTNEIDGLPGVWRVDSLATVPFIHSAADGALSLEPSLAAGVPATPALIDALRVGLRSDRIAPGTLVTSDEQGFAINVVLEQGAESFYGSVIEAIDRLIGDRPVDVSGVPLFRIAADDRTREELVRFVPATVAVVAVLLGAIFSSLRLVLIPLLPSALATWIMLGAMGWLEVPITITTVVLPSVLLALGCAYSLHLMTAVTGAAPEARESAMLDVALPIALSGLTTSLGFVAISFVRIEAIQQIGAFGALGVVLVLAATLTAGPAMVTVWPPPQRRPRLQSFLEGRVSEALVGFSIRRMRLVVGLWAVTLIFVITGIARLEVETDVIEWFRKSDPIRSSYEEIRARLSGISPMNVVVQSTGEVSVSDPAVIAAIDALSAHLAAQPEVGRVLSIADALRQIHGVFIDDASQPLPSDSALIDQYLILLDSKAYTQDLITPDRAAANLMIRVDDNASGALVGLGRKVDTWWASHGPESTEAWATGIMFEFGRAEDEIAFGQLRGLLFAFLTVLAILVAIFRWWRLSVITLVPNVLPVAMGFGAMGMLGVPLDAGTVVIGNLAFGIAVDDSIHAVTGFFAERSRGEGSAAALRTTYRRILPPIVYTTTVVALGFAMLGVSDFTLIQHLGFLTAGLMILCLLADALLLPALLSRFASGPLPAERSSLR
jgi:predicted RND superfamily exporter protein